MFRLKLLHLITAIIIGYFVLTRATSLERWIPYSIVSDANLYGSLHFFLLILIADDRVTVYNDVHKPLPKEMLRTPPKETFPLRSVS